MGLDCVGGGGGGAVGLDCVGGGAGGAGGTVGRDCVGEEREEQWVWTVSEEEREEQWAGTMSEEEREEQWAGTVSEEEREEQWAGTVLEEEEEREEQWASRLGWGECCSGHVLGLRRSVHVLVMCASWLGRGLHIFFVVPPCTFEVVSSPPGWPLPMPSVISGVVC